MIFLNLLRMKKLKNMTKIFLIQKKMIEKIDLIGIQRDFIMIKFSLQWKNFLIIANTEIIIIQNMLQMEEN